MGIIKQLQKILEQEESEVSFNIGDRVEINFNDDDFFSRDIPNCYGKEEADIIYAHIGKKGKVTNTREEEAGIYTVTFDDGEVIDNLDADYLMDVSLRDI